MEQLAMLKANNRQSATTAKKLISPWLIGVGLVIFIVLVCVIMLGPDGLKEWGSFS